MEVSAPEVLRRRMLRGGILNLAAMHGVVYVKPVEHLQRFALYPALQ